METLKISAKTLGALAMPDFCPRCFWISQRSKGKLPFVMPFPGIFISIDRHGKNLIHAYFDAQKKLPAWYPEIGKVVRYVPPGSLHWSKFSLEDPKTGIHFRGEPDDIFELKDGSFHIVDYKTARATPAQDALLPLYQAQLNGYAYICAIGKREYTPVSGLSLIYTEPQTAGGEGAGRQLHWDGGFALRFSAKLETIKLEPSRVIPGLLRRARSIYDQASAPKGRPGCEDCDLFARLVLMTSD
jgi:hypothetical protein